MASPQSLDWRIFDGQEPEVGEAWMSVPDGTACAKSQGQEDTWPVCPTAKSSMWLEQYGAK